MGPDQTVTLGPNQVDTAIPATPNDPELARLEVRTAWAFPQLPRPVVHPWSDEPVLLLDRGEPWLYGPVARDPLARDGRTVLPRAQRRRLEALARLGIGFQHVAIAHQLRPDGPVAELVPQLLDGPRACTDAVARAVAGSVPPHPLAARALGAVDWLLHRDGWLATADLLLDPLVFGVLGPTTPVPGQPCLWYPLAVWRW